MGPRLGLEVGTVSRPAVGGRGSTTSVAYGAAVGKYPALGGRENPGEKVGTVTPESIPLGRGVLGSAEPRIAAPAGGTPGAATSGDVSGEELGLGGLHCGTSVSSSDETPPPEEVPPAATSADENSLWAKLPTPVAT